MAVVPTIVTPEQAADALGITPHELATNIDAALQTRLHTLADRVRQQDAGSMREFVAELEGIRNLYESSLSCWQLVDRAAVDVDEPS